MAAKSQVFHPSYRRGARLAHAWIKPVKSKSLATLTGVDPVWLEYLPELGAKQTAAWRYSTLDCVPHGVYTFFYMSSSWGKRAPDLARLFALNRIPLRVLEIGKDFEFADKKPGKAWVEGYGKSSGILVRPDQHIAIIAPAPGKTTAQSVMEVVLRDMGML